MDLGALWSQEGVAVVGASESRHYPRSIIKNLMDAGYPKDRIFPVNPRYNELFGIPCYPSISAIGRAVPLTVLVTHSGTVNGLLREAAECGTQAAVVLADGYAEQGAEGKVRQKELAALAGELRIPVLGPNTLGYYAPGFRSGTWAGGEFPAPFRAGGAALVFQSSGTLNLAFSLALHRRIGLRAGVSVGNEAIVDAADFIEFFVQDPDTRCIGVFLETTTRPRRLAQALGVAAASGKPVVMLKVGRSERARRNAVAHTGRMASSARAWQALLERLHVILVSDLDELMETVALMNHHSALPQAGGVGICTISGGDCSLLSDLAEPLGVPLPDVTEPTRAVLVDALQKPTLLGNPLDCENLRREDAGQFERCIDALCADPEIGIVAYRMNLEAEPNDALRRMYRGLIESAQRHGKMAVVLSRAAEHLSSDWFEFFEDLGVPFLPSYRTALSALGYLIRWSRWDGDPGWLPGALPPSVTEDGESGRVLGWEETMRWLKEAGVPYVTSRFARTPEEAAYASQTLSFPVAAKCLSASWPHKTEVGALRLGLARPEDVAQACISMRSSLSAAQPDAIIDGFEIQEMMRGDVEMILGMARDPMFGPVVLVGLGGVLAEVMRDTALALPPIDPQEARRLLERLQGAALLHGVRGGKPVDVEALAQVISRFADAVMRSADVSEIDLNPVMVGPQGMAAVDALITARS